MTEGTVEYRIEGKLRGEAVLDYPGSFDPEEDQDYILDFNLKVSGESIDIGKFMIKPLRGNRLEKGVEDKEIPPGKNNAENVTGNINNEFKPEKTEKDDDKGKSDNLTSSDNQSNNKNQSQRRKEK